MRKIFSILLIITIFLLGGNNVFALNVEQVSLNVKDKSSTITIKDDGIGNFKIAPKIEFNEIGDYITYKLVLKNTDSNKYKVESVNDDNKSEYIKMEYDYNEEMNTDNKEILITLKYVKELTDPEEEFKSVKLTIKLIDEDNKEENININSGSDTETEGSSEKSPQTGDNIQSRVLWLFISLTGLCITVTYLVKIKKYNKGLLSILLLLTIIPTIVIAGETKELVFNISFDNIKINVKYTVSFDTDGGNEIDSQIIEYNKKATKPNDPTKEYYNFMGWLDEDNKEFDFNNPITKNIKLTALWEKKSYTINYNSDGGNDVASETKKYNERFTKPEDPIKNGYTFNKWVDENNEEYDFENTLVIADINLKAEWTINEYDINYNGLEGVLTPPSNPSKYNVETSTFTLNNPTKDGYDFDGWTGTDLTNLTKDVVITKGSTGERTYTANWTELFTVSFDTKEGTPTPDNQIVRDGEYANLPEDPTRTGYEFEGWQLNEENFDFENTPVTVDILLTAKWSKITYAINYDLKDGVATNPDTYNIETETFTLNNPTKEHYEFIGWTGSNGNTPQTTVKVTKGTIGVLNYIANWEAVDYTINYDLKDGVATNPTTYNIETETFTLNNPTKEHYEFIGWTGSNGNTPQTTVTISQGTAGVLNYTANWEAVDYNITYNLDGGTNHSNNPPTYTIETNSFTLGVPTKAGYVFKGWTGSNGDTPQTSVTITKGTTGALTYNANWNELYTVTFDAKDGTTSETERKVEKGEQIGTLPTITEPTGYDFIGWYLGDNEIDETYTVNSNVVVEAKYEKEEYTVIFNTDGGTPVPAEQKVKYQETVLKPSDPEKTGYIFKGWKDSSGNDYNFNNLVTEDLTLTAEWQVAKSTLDLAGPDMMFKMKQLANPGSTALPDVSAAYSSFHDTNVKAFKRADEANKDSFQDKLIEDNIVSTSTSLAPTYMWFDDETGTMYYYTEAAVVYIDGSMEKMFARFSNLTDLSGLKDFDVSGATDMNRLFQDSKSLNDTSLTSLEDWDTSNVINMAWVFGGAAEDKGNQVTTLVSLSKWDVSNVRSFNQAFKNMRQLTNLGVLEDDPENPGAQKYNGLGSWNVKSVGYYSSGFTNSGDNVGFSQMFNNCTLLNDASAIVGWDIKYAVTSAVANGKNRNWAFDKMLQKTPARSSQPEFSEWSGEWAKNNSGDYTGTYNPNENAE